MFAAIGDQPSLDFQQRDIGLTANESEKIVAVRFDPVRPLIPARRRREISPVALKRQTQRTALAILTPKRLAAALRDIPSSTTASTTRLRRSSESAILAASLAASLKIINRPIRESPHSIRWEIALARFSITLNRHCEFGTGLRPTWLDETGARTPAPLVGAVYKPGTWWTGVRRHRGQFPDQQIGSGRDAVSRDVCDGSEARVR